MHNSFDSVASVYDQMFTNSLIGRAQRQIVWKYLLQRKVRNKHVLEINCGTGEDAVFLAENANIVLATDASENMLKQTRQKAENRNQHLNISCKKWNLMETGTFDVSRKFNVIFSNFGGLNCIPPERLCELGAELHALLHERGSLIVVVMGRFCLMETLYFFCKGKWASMFRRLRRNPVMAKLDTRATMQTWYHTSKEIQKHLSQYFQFYKTKPVGVFIPPSYLEHFVGKRPLIFRILCWLDRITTASFYSKISDHYILELKKKHTAS